MSEAPEPPLQELVAELVVSLAHLHRRLDEIGGKQAQLGEQVDDLRRTTEALGDDISSIKREILPSQSLRLDDFSDFRTVLRDQTRGEP